MTHDEIIEMARQALKQEPREDWNSTAWVFADETLEAFAKLVAEKALAQPEQEPVAWQGVHDQTDLYYRKPPQADARPLYTTPSAPPPQRTWVGLTDDEIEALASWWPSYDQMPAIKVLIKDVTNSLKEKNQ